MDVPSSSLPNIGWVTLEQLDVLNRFHFKVHRVLFLISCKHLLVHNPSTKTYQDSCPSQPGIYSPSTTTVSNCLKHLSLKTQVHREAQLQLGQRNTAQLAWAPQITVSQPTNHWLHSHPFGECSTRCTPPWYRARNAKRSATSDPQVSSFKITHFARSSFNKKIEVIKVESMYFTNKTVSKKIRCSLHVLQMKHKIGWKSMDVIFNVRRCGFWWTFLPHTLGTGRKLQLKSLRVSAGCGVFTSQD